MYFICIFVFLLMILFILINSRKRMYKYNQRQDYCYDLKNPKIFNIENINLKEFNKNETLILKLTIKSNILSKLFTPYIKVSLENKVEKTFFEHGAAGIRYIDISTFSGFDNIKIFAQNCNIVSKNLEVYDFEDLDIKNKKLLIVAPHPDDAEISSFGLYSSAKESFIVTITAGEGEAKYCDFEENKEKRSILKGNLRVFDALTTGLLGNVKFENNIALGYFNGTIEKMYKNKKDIISSENIKTSDINYFRKVKHSKIKTNEEPISTWGSLVEDFVQIINSTSPDFIFTLHPQIDLHKDHQYITLALIEAIEKLGLKDKKLLTSTNHLNYNEIYPYGNVFSTTSLAPRFKIPFVFDKIYSHKLSKEQQIYKFYALEAMHDLRDSTIQISLKKLFIFFYKQLRRYINGKEQSYYRRAIRTNEIFYITNCESLKKVYREMELI
ncbi:PIG-L family deacetylase [Aliarcobacter butzleri]|uniref:PIG-L family deacetylase n=1 Tax=Aliarcobacter butzleri TaxID=28197 RepID=UPI00191B591C|nr:PIG-L family deacetylase [Aliarcobacter butzleri]